MGRKHSRRALWQTEDFADVAFVAYSEPSAVYEWYSKRPRERDVMHWMIQCSEAQGLIDYLAYRRSEPLIDLALAKYGFFGPVLRRLYERAPTMTRVVLCGNPELLCSGEHLLRRRKPSRFLTALLESGADEEVRAICEAEDHQDWALRSILRSVIEPDNPGEEQLAIVSPDRYRLILASLSRNPRMQTARRDTPRYEYWDGAADTEYAEPFQEAWHLADRLPADKTWVHYLGELFFRLPRGWMTAEEVEPLIEKWRCPGKMRGTEREADEDYPFEQVRAALICAHLRPSSEWVDHPDGAYRLAFLATYDPLDKEWMRLDPLEIDVAAEKRVYWLNKNTRVWRLTRGRKMLLAAAATADTPEIPWAVKQYEEQEARHRATHPDWFDDEVGLEEYVGDEAREPASSHQVARVLVRLEKLKKQQSTMSGAILVVLALGVLMFFNQ